VSAASVPDTPPDPTGDGFVDGVRWSAWYHARFGAAIRVFYSRLYGGAYAEMENEYSEFPDQQRRHQDYVHRITSGDQAGSTMTVDEKWIKVGLGHEEFFNHVLLETEHHGIGSKPWMRDVPVRNPAVHIAYGWLARAEDPPSPYVPWQPVDMVLLNPVALRWLLRNVIDRDPVYSACAPETVRSAGRRHFLRDHPGHGGCRAVWGSTESNKDWLTKNYVVTRDEARAYGLFDVFGSRERFRGY
jgi:hypothetical protein